MKKALSLFLLCIAPGLFASQALHQWEGQGQLEGTVFKLKLIIMENERFIALVQTRQAPIAVEGTWKEKPENILKLAISTEEIVGEKIPLDEVTVYLVEENSAVAVGEGLGIELTRILPATGKPDRSKKATNKRAPANGPSDIIIRRD